MDKNKCDYAVKIDGAIQATFKDQQTAVDFFTATCKDQANEWTFLKGEVSLCFKKNGFYVIKPTNA